MNRYFVHDYISESSNDDEAVEKCLAACRDLSERVIVFSEKDYLLSRSVLLPSNTSVIIDGCTVGQADYTYDTLFRGDNLTLSHEDENGTPLRCEHIENIKIIGKNGAKISGPCKNRRGYHPILCEEQEMVGDFWGWKTLTVSLSNCDGFEICGLKFEKARCWTMSFDLCKNGYIHDLEIHTNVKNGDGIDFRSGCSYCTVENIVGCTSDDTVACTALYKDDKVYPIKNYLHTLEPSICITDGEGRGDIHHITVRNIRSNGSCHGVICLAANGCRLHDVVIEDVVERARDGVKMWREATVKIYTGYGDGYKNGDISDITVNRVSGAYADKTVYSNAEVENVILKGITHENDNAIAVVLDKPNGFVVC